MPSPLVETSGLAAGQRNPGVLWAHNDSGNEGLVYAIDETGRLLAVVDPGVNALDWEDIAVGPGPDGRPWVWVADTGDNLTIRPRATIYRFPEPALAQDGGTVEPSVIERIDVTYPSGPTDVEALLVDPVTGDAFLVGKEADADNTVPVFRLPAATGASAGQPIELEFVTRVQGRRRRGPGPTAADVSGDGTLVMIGNGRDAFVWPRDPAVGLATLFASQPVAPCRFEPGGGEALALSADGRKAWAVNEGEGARLRRFDRA